MDELRNEQMMEELVDIKKDYLSVQGIDLGLFYFSFVSPSETEVCQMFSDLNSKKIVLEEFPSIRGCRVYSSMGESFDFNEGLYFNDEIFILFHKRVEADAIVHELSHIGFDRIWSEEDCCEILGRDRGLKVLCALQEGVAMQMEGLEYFGKKYYGERMFQEIRDIFDYKIGALDPKAVERAKELRNLWVAGSRDGVKLDFINEECSYLVGGQFIRGVWETGKDNLASIVNRLKDNIPNEEEILEPRLYVERTRGV
ncbi:hypothetical protein ISS05_05245 [Candidatus Woesearchaeota archaeon]|nr:hypothetical protein [Candidatus Woesearchaeota archaeon]